MGKLYVQKANASFITVFFIFFMFMFIFIASAETTFPDLDENHWSYDSVMTLAGDGTISGFEDGTFRPNDTVSRAQFVRMIGRGNVRRETDFDDVSTEHWAYEDIMYSGLKTEGNTFNPDVPITRFEVLQLIWQRAGAKEGVIAPKIITDQADNKDAVAWGYVYGLMIGDDGLHLRLDDVLSRAEAAALIVRARGINEASPKNNFVDIIKPELLERIFNSLKLFNDISYEPDRTITNGEMARAAIRLGSEEHTLTYMNLSALTTFEHMYAKDIYYLGNTVLSEDYINAEFADKEAIMRDTIAALTYNIIRKSHVIQKYGDIDNYYVDIRDVTSKMMNICLTYAYNNGIQLYADGKINPDKTITLKEFVAILLQFDYLIGTQSGITTDYKQDKLVKQDMALEKDLSKYPGNYEDFQCILQDIPLEVYTTPFADVSNDKKPKDIFNFAREYSIVFTTMLRNYEKNIENANNMEMRITYYPSLVCDNGNGHTLRVKIEIIKVPEELLIKDVFNPGEKIDDTQKLYNNMAFYADITTGQKLSGINLPPDTAELKQIISIIN